MSYYYDDFYNEPSEFDEKMEELKESLAGAVKSEFLEEMERLKKENKKLQGIKENFEKVKRDYEDKKRECERVMRNAEQNALRKRTADIMEKYKLFMYSPHPVRLYKKKCDKCDSSRLVKIKLPSGKEVYDDCECQRESAIVEVPVCKIRYLIEDGNSKIVAFYEEYKTDGEGRYYTLQYANSTYSEGENIDQVDFSDLDKIENPYRLLFRSEERCWEYCDYLNRKNNVPEDMIYKLNGDVYDETD